MNRSRQALSFGVIVLLACGYAIPSPAYSQASAAPPDSAQLDKLVAPIALYPDPLVAQILPASTYPVQVVAAARALASGGRPDRATASQWNPSIQALLSFPTVLKMMSDKINWTTQLGQAVAANQSDVMAAIQHVRHEAQAAGNLTSNDKQVVSVEGSGDSSTIIIQPANPQYIYVPQYNPVAILAPPPYYIGNVPAPAYGLLTFGPGFVAGAATAYACNWGYGGSGSVTVNDYYHYSPTDTYAAYHPATGTYGAYNPATGNSARYNPKTGTYTGYDAKTGTYGAYNPATGKYGTYDPSTGAYNKNGTTGTYKPGSSGSYSAWRPPASSDVGRSTDDYRASQYAAGGSGSHYSGGDLASGSQLGSSPASGAQYRDSAAARGAGPTSGGQLGGGWSGLGSRDFGANADRGFGGGWGGGRGFGDSGGDRGFGGGSGGDSFRGLGGGGWDARAASDRGFASFGGGGFGGRSGGFRGGGFRR